MGNIEHSQWNAAVLAVAAVLLLFCCTICLVAQHRAHRRRRHDDGEDAPLLQRPDVSTPSRNPQQHVDVASIGTPARDFVRLSSLPASIFRFDEYGRRCMACNESGECVALRPCGHVVLCRACSDFVYTCPQCSQYISGVQPAPAVVSRPGQDGSNGGGLR